MQIEENVLLLAILMLIHQVASDLEHTCTDPEYRTPYTETCVLRMVDYVVSRCIPPQEQSFQPVVREIFIDFEEANALLNYPIGDYRSGLPCECCVYRCKVKEFEQYCSPIQSHQRRQNARLRRSAQRRRNNHFTSSDIQNIYESINRSVSDSRTTLETSKFSLKKFDQISKIKAWKLKNIENKLLTKFGLGDENGANIPVNKSRPLGKVTNDESAVDALKPKLFPDVNKDLQPSPHHHRHKYLTQRDDVNNEY